MPVDFHDVGESESGLPRDEQESGRGNPLRDAGPDAGKERRIDACLLRDRNETLVGRYLERLDQREVGRIGIPNGGAAQSHPDSGAATPGWA